MRSAVSTKWQSTQFRLLVTITFVNYRTVAFILVHLTWRMIIKSWYKLIYSTALEFKRRRRKEGVKIYRGRRSNTRHLDVVVQISCGNNASVSLIVFSQQLYAISFHSCFISFLSAVLFPSCLLLKRVCDWRDREFNHAKTRHCHTAVNEKQEEEEGLRPGNDWFRHS